MSFMHEAKYRGCVPLTEWIPSHAQPRPGPIEATMALKKLLTQEKVSILCVMSVSTETGIKCVDTSMNPPKVIMSNSIAEIAHCGIDVHKPEYFTCIVGHKDDPASFVCHVFKCINKETACKVARAVASACTLAYQMHVDKRRQASVRGAPPSIPSSGPVTVVPTPLSRAYPDGDPIASQRQSFQRSVRGSMHRESVRGSSQRLPKLTDAWFRPSMGRAEVASILRDARVGDFIVRESQTQPGDYALSVQIGNSVWTGLLIQTPAGLQVGKNGNMTFNELTDFVSYHMRQPLMQDAFGQPLFLLLPGEDAGPAPMGHRPMGRQPSGGMQRKPTFKNPPVLEEPATSSPRGIPASIPDEEEIRPACGWPSDDDEDEDASGEPVMDEKDEQAAFEAIMNGGHFGGMGAGSGDDSGGEGGDGEDGDGYLVVDGLNRSSDVRVDMGKVKAAGPPPVVGAPPVNPPAAKESALQVFSKKLFASVPSTDGLVDGKDVRGVLMHSGLDVQVLGNIWMEVDQDRRGKLDQDQFTLVLGMISQWQLGEEPSLNTIDPDTVPPPKMDVA